MRRRIRECYRLNRPDNTLGCPDADVVFIYVADRLTDSARVSGAMHRLLAKITGLPAQTAPTTAQCEDTAR